MPDSSVDVVLLLGPLYNLPEANNRIRALREADRVVRPGGVVHAAAISRWAARLHGILVSRLHNVYPVLTDIVDEIERSGVIAPAADPAIGACRAVSSAATEQRPAN